MQPQLETSNGLHPFTHKNIGAIFHLNIMSHSYEELRATALDIFAGREIVPQEIGFYDNLRLGLGHVFRKRDIHSAEQLEDKDSLDASDKEKLLEVFWDLFRDGIITLGLNDNERNFPYFRVTKLGFLLAEKQESYFFHDVFSYEKTILLEVPDIAPLTLLYLKEAMQAFSAGCMLSSTVMLGVSTEHTFNLLVEKSQERNKIFSGVSKEKGLLRRFNKFSNILQAHTDILTKEINEDLSTNFSGLLSIIRNYRNESGHPTGKIIDRENAFILLRLFIPCCKKMYQIMRHFS